MEVQRQLAAFELNPVLGISPQPTIMGPDFSISHTTLRSLILLGLMYISIGSFIQNGIF